MDTVSVLVLGGNGFIGRHAVASLRRSGHRVIVGSRHAGALGQSVREVKMQRLLRAEDWLALIADVDVVLNCVGILRERPSERYDVIHHRAPAALAGACAATGKRLIHVSALGLSSQARSRFIRSKRDGERAIHAAAPDCVIVRPSLLDGDGGFGARWLRRLASAPVHMVPAGARGRVAALSVRDLGVALARLCGHDDGGARALEFGGPVAMTMREYLAVLRAPHLRAAPCIEIPHWLARLASHLCDLLHWSPYSFGHFELMCADNLPAVNALPAVLGRAPLSVGTGAPRPGAEPEASALGPSSAALR